MKRYDIDTGLYGNGYTAKGDSDGEWVRYDDVEDLKIENARLKELNRGMATALKDISYCEIPGYHQKIIIELLAKAGEGE